MYRNKIKEFLDKKKKDIKSFFNLEEIIVDNIDLAQLNTWKIFDPVYEIRFQGSDLEKKERKDCNAVLKNYQQCKKQKEFLEKEIKFPTIICDSEKDGYYLEEKLDGETLEVFIESYLNNPIEAALERMKRVMYSVGESIANMHNKGMNHSDLHYRNIFLIEGEEIYFLDPEEHHVIDSDDDKNSWDLTRVMLTPTKNMKDHDIGFYIDELIPEILKGYMNGSFNKTKAKSDMGKIPDLTTNKEFYRTEKVEYLNRIYDKVKTMG